MSEREEGLRRLHPAGGDLRPLRGRGSAAEPNLPLRYLLLPGCGQDRLYVYPPAADFPTPCISGSRASFARKLQGGYKARDHVMYFGGVAKILGDASMRELYAMAGCSRLGIARE